MKLDFVILWFENQPKDVQTQMEEIKEYILNMGFNPEIKIEENSKNIGRLSESQELFYDYDLIVVDYDLGVPDENGDHVAELIRKRFGFTDIIFYSGNTTTDLRRKIYDRQIDGVYCMYRPDLTECLRKHIDQVVNRLSRLEAMRGLAMDTVGKCDDAFKKLLPYIYDQSPVTEKNSLEKKLDEYVESARSHQENEYQNCETFKEKLSSRSVTSFHLQKLALHYTKSNPKYYKYRNELRKFYQEVLEPRNILGHAVEQRGEGGWIVASENDSIGNENFPGLRRNMIKHFKNIRELHKEITSQDI